MPATGTPGTAGARSPGGVASGPDVAGPVATVDAVAHGQPGGRAERRATGLPDRARSPGRRRFVARGIARAGRVRAPRPARGLASDRRRAGPRSTLEPGGQPAGSPTRVDDRRARPARELAASSRTGRVEARRPPVAGASFWRLAGDGRRVADRIDDLWPRLSADELP